MPERRRVATPAILPILPILPSESGEPKSEGWIGERGNGSPPPVPYGNAGASLVERSDKGRPNGNYHTRQACILPYYLNKPSTITC
jgi:hypothetical protein